MQPCLQCSAPLETPLACGSCGALEPLGPGTGRALTPFEIFGLAPGYAVDGPALRKLLLRFARLVHPDFHGSRGPEARARAEEASARLNGAYEILATDAARADWLITHLGGPDESAERTMPKAFLLEVLEWNELLAEAREADPGTSDGARTIARATTLAASLADERRAAFERLAAILTPLAAAVAPAPGAARAEPDPALRAARAELNAVRYIDKALAEIRALELARATTRS